jgi:hypothetical protein
VRRRDIRGRREGIDFLPAQAGLHIAAAVPNHPHYQQQQQHLAYPCPSDSRTGSAYNNRCVNDDQLSGQ